MKRMREVETMPCFGDLAEALKDKSKKNLYLVCDGKDKSLPESLKLERNVAIFLIFDGNFKTSLKFEIADGVKAEVNILGLLDQAQKQRIDITSVIYGEECNYSINSLAFLKGEGSRFINLNTQIISGAKRSVINERDEAVILSDKAKNISIPALCSGEDDAECGHQFYAGKIDQEQLDFLGARGIDKKKALLLLSKSKVQPEMFDYFINNFNFE